MAVDRQDNACCAVLKIPVALDRAARVVGFL